MRGLWSGRLAGESEQWERFCTRFTVVTKRELSRQAKVYGSVLHPHLRSWGMGHDWKNDITNTTAEMSFLRRRFGVTLRVKMRSSVICEELWVEPLLLCAERSQLRWFRHLVRMSPCRLAMEVFQANPAGKRLRCVPRSRWGDYIPALAWERLRIPQSESADVVKEREVWSFLLNLLPPRLDHG